MGGRQFPKPVYKKPTTQNINIQLIVPPQLPAKEGHWNRGDSVGIIALIITGFAMVLTPPIWLKVIMLTAGIVGMFVSAKKSHWTHAWTSWKQYGLASLLAAAILAIGIPQLVHQWRIEHAPAVQGIGNQDIKNLQQSLDGIGQKLDGIAAVQPTPPQPGKRDAKPCSPSKITFEGGSLSNNGIGIASNSDCPPIVNFSGTRVEGNGTVYKQQLPKRR